MSGSAELKAYYAPIGRTSIDPELIIRMLLVGHLFAIRSERAFCCEVQVNLAYRWFCRLGIEDRVADHSAFSRARDERFSEGDIDRALIIVGVEQQHGAQRQHRPTVGEVRGQAETRALPITMSFFVPSVSGRWRRPA